MNDYAIKIQIEDGKVKEILARLTAAQEEIYKCYDELNSLGVLTVVKKDASGN